MYSIGYNPYRVICIVSIGWTAKAVYPKHILQIKNTGTQIYRKKILFFIFNKFSLLNRLFEHVMYFFENPSGNLKAFLENPSILVPSSQAKRFGLLQEEVIYRILQIVAYSDKLTELFIGEQEWMKNFRSIFIELVDIFMCFFLKLNYCSICVQNFRIYFYLYFVEILLILIIFFHF